MRATPGLYNNSGAIFRSPAVCYWSDACLFLGSPLGLRPCIPRAPSLLERSGGRRDRQTEAEREGERERPQALLWLLEYERHRRKRVPPSPLWFPEAPLAVSAATTAVSFPGGCSTRKKGERKKKTGTFPTFSLSFP